MVSNETARSRVVRRPTEMVAPGALRGSCLSARSVLRLGEALGASFVEEHAASVRLGLQSGLA
jgi:hypothetical protein